MYVQINQQNELDAPGTMNIHLYDFLGSILEWS